MWYIISREIHGVLAASSSDDDIGGRKNVALKNNQENQLVHSPATLFLLKKSSFGIPGCVRMVVATSVAGEEGNQDMLKRCFLS